MPEKQPDVYNIIWASICQYIAQNQILLTGMLMAGLLSFARVMSDKKKAFNQLGETMQKAAQELGIAIRWGGDWNMNGKSEDERFYDGPHFELLRTVYP